MSRLFYHVMQDNAGNLLFDVSGTMRLAGSGTLATIYGDEALTVIIANPMTNHPSFGSFKCFLGAGDYDFYMAKSGYTFETLTGVQGHGTMAQQDASAVNITGGQVVAQRIGVNAVVDADGIGTLRVGAEAVIQGNMRVLGTAAIGTTPGPSGLSLAYNRATGNGIAIQPSADSGAGSALYFQNAALTLIGSITTTGSATAYNTTSDARLKAGIETLVGGLDVVRALRPVAFRWKADETPGHGFLAHEVQALMPEVVTGAPGAVDEAGGLVPQQMDLSKFVPWLVSAVKELTQQVEMLTAKLAAAGA